MAKAIKVGSWKGGRETLKRPPSRAVENVPHSLLQAAGKSAVERPSVHVAFGELERSGGQ